MDLTTGVADYFAILGVGNDLVWKHNQKQSFFSDNDQVVEDSPEDLQTRFGREIVQVCLVISRPRPSEASASASSVTSGISSTVSGQAVNLSQQQHHTSAAADTSSQQIISPVMSYASEGGSSIHHHHQGLVPNSPSSEATSNTFSAGPQIPTSNLPSSPTNVPLENGWNMVVNTLPALKAGHAILYDHQNDTPVQGPLLWSPQTSFGANLHLMYGLRDELLQLQAKTMSQYNNSSGSNSSSTSTKQQQQAKTLATLRRKVGSLYNYRRNNNNKQRLEAMTQEPRFYIAYRRRSDLQTAQHASLSNNNSNETMFADGSTQVPAAALPAVADVQLHYVRLHRDCVDISLISSASDTASNASSTSNTNSSSAILKNKRPLGQLWKSYYQSQVKPPSPDEKASRAGDDAAVLDVLDCLTLPADFDEWSFPDEFRYVRDLRNGGDQHHSNDYSSSRPRANSAILLEPNEQEDASSAVVDGLLSGSGGLGPSTSYASTQHDGEDDGFGIEALDGAPCLLDKDAILPKLVSSNDLPDDHNDENATVSSLQQQSSFWYVPILAIRRQRVTSEERFHEDPAAVELAVSFCDGSGRSVEPDPTRRIFSNNDEEDDNDDDDEEEGEGFHLLGVAPWIGSSGTTNSNSRKAPLSRTFGVPVIMMRHNRPFGFCDATFATKVQGRFPFQNYKDLPLPEEELPMFCYPTGCRLHRACFSDAPVPQYYGFVVKNERGDSIYVSCVSFMEPLSGTKVAQLASMSELRRYTSLAHRKFCENRRPMKDPMGTAYAGSDVSTEVASSCILTGFDDMTTFENKTICLVSRYPFWTSFRKFLSHLHILSTSSYEIPLERFVSHLLLSVPVPKPGGPNVIVALPAGDPMVLSMPAEKDFPLVDLPFERLVACLDIKTIVMIVLGMLVLERKVIILSTRPSLVLDVCELLRSLLFPFDLCAPYVPRLTEPFKSSLDFPGAIFVGIHNDGTPDGLAAMVKRELPEESITVDLDTGEIDCDGDKHELVKTAWDIIPEIPRSALVSELQILCRDAAIVDGQEPLDSQYDSAFDVTLTAAVDDFGIGNQSREPLDDRAIRDAFFRFFCAVLGGYARYLVAPDADFLVSGNEWFDSNGFLGVVSSSRSAYLSALVSTQLFQAFIQKRTEASDVRCLLFDECLATYHIDAKPYGRLGDDVETLSVRDKDQPPMVYSLLVDQAAALQSTQDQSILSNQSMDASEADSSFSQSNSILSIKYSESAVNASGDIVTAASAQGLPDGRNYVYCVDGNPCFPLTLEKQLLLPLEPETWNLQIPKSSNPLLARSGRELEDGARQKKKATSSRGMQKNLRCLWQLPKLMGSHFLGAWLLCIPARVSMGNLSHEQQSKYFLQALGAMRGLRSKKRIVPDEAAYRALMVACGRTESDRRIELVKLWGLLRIDGIFPSAVTLGQYTRALAEGYSKRLSSQEPDYAGLGLELTESSSRIGRMSVTSMNWRGGTEFESSVMAVDGYLTELEAHGRLWRQKSGSEKSGDRATEKKRSANRPWLPVVFSSSFVPVRNKAANPVDAQTVRFVAIWSRTRSCNNCGYIPLEEEVQAGWDVSGEEDIPGAVACARCGSMLVPMLAYRELSPEEALDAGHQDSVPGTGGPDLPPQIQSTIDLCDENASYVTYLSPMSMRFSLEQLVETYGEEVLIRDHLRERDPQIFYNLWWYCARFSLPLPLPVVQQGDRDLAHFCAFAGWDQSAALRGCVSGAKALIPLMSVKAMSYDSSIGSGEVAPIDPFDDVPILSRYNLQGFHSNVWDQEDLSKILVALVEACDKRDFKPVVENAIEASLRRTTSRGNHDGERDTHLELDVYRTILYLAKYQCTSAFHSFFPATLKACKGSHYWCPKGKPVPAFDRLVREAIHRIRTGKDQVSVTPIHEVSDVALGFRCIFGHLI